MSDFTNPFSSSFEDNEVYFLSFGFPDKPGIAKGLIGADTLAGKLLQTSLTHLMLKICLSQPHKMLQANKVLRLA